ncbi:SMP-30/gluconolactonase/LRE family protein [Mesorhizobium sp. B3-1-3]|uniref:SMP-30/gluconolactonase/LRE family protein n=1 Tax=unclassified Mesorhizobium TaxID=325217 RepID=UPI00112B7B72|nr:MULTISPECIES: SMP-30/gluconolactonase/LRE family protein [unclassified Mesorhizobium]TPI65565.1 SMP-30/gluconolactonase/LRE family protein [Mesorhizobium sp. B3-1-3]TPI67257.1 SMP-30/gluconolactonase/LRE family protein [Mesorhizobium sp. B3-1-8]
MDREPVFEILDPRFARLFIGTARLDILFSGCRWAEGPAYFPAGRYLVWSDIPNDRMLRYDECSGEVSVFRHPSGHSNGNTVDRAGRLVTCEHGGRRVSRTEVDGTVITLADRFEGKRLNSPNDVVERSDGSLWFTDPTYGIDSDYEGNKGESEQAGNFVYRLDPETGSLTVVGDDFVQPNGIAFSPDEMTLYIVDTGASHRKDGPRHIRKFAVGAETLIDGGVFAESTNGYFDGLRLDTEGRIWTSAGDGVHCYDVDGTLIGKIKVPEVVANVCFGGPKRNYLYICGTTSLYGVRLPVTGAKTF